MNVETKCLHAGYEPQNGEPRQLPIYQADIFTPVCRTPQMTRSRQKSRLSRAA